LRGLTPRAEIEKKSQKVSDSHRNDVSPLTQGLRYRATCDVTLRNAMQGSATQAPRSFCKKYKQYKHERALA